MICTVYLHFNSGIHLGEAGLGLEQSGLVLHSDTLYSALWIAWNKRFGTEIPKLILSSAFPYINNKRFYPKPMLPAPGFSESVIEQYGKEFKSVRFVSEDNLRKWLSADDLDFQSLIDDSKELERCVVNVVRPMVNIDRISSDSNLFFYGETRFPSSCESGLFFLVELSEHDIDKFKVTLDFLADVGIGGKRSSGLGTFKYTFVEDYVPFDCQDPDCYMTLSLVYPAQDEELKGNLMSYQLCVRSGWVESLHGTMNLRHKRVPMFTEGSIFRHPARGTVADVSPHGCPHPVYRNGRAFNLKAKGEFPDDR